MLLPLELISKSIFKEVYDVAIGMVFFYGVTSSGKTHTMHVIYDLLEPTGQNLCVREDAQGTYVEGKEEEVVLSPARRQLIFHRVLCPTDKEVYTSVLIKRFTHPVNIPKPPQNVVSSSSALANSPAFVRPSRTPTSTRFGYALNIETLVAAAEHRETPIDETVKGPGCIFTLIAIAKWECSSYGRTILGTLIICS
ncbi:phosphoacetylglucosamine mutase [Tanacetum coccineum]